MNKHSGEELKLVRPRVISVGEKVHIIARRTFEKDVRRHFAGTASAVSDTPSGLTATSSSATR